MARINFEEASQEAFEVFADELAEHLPEAEATFHSAPVLGEPYIVVKAREWVAGNKMFGVFSLIVDVGDTLVVEEGEAYVVEW